jgi:hypothetical protein
MRRRYILLRNVLTVRKQSCTFLLSCFLVLGFLGTEQLAIEEGSKVEAASYIKESDQADTKNESYCTSGFFSFEEEVEIKGNYVYDPNNTENSGITFWVAEESLPHFPKFSRDREELWLTFINGNQMKQMLDLSGDKIVEGVATILIDHVHYSSCEVRSTSELIKVISYEEWTESHCEI